MTDPLRRRGRKSRGGAWLFFVLALVLAGLVGLSYAPFTEMEPPEGDMFAPLFLVLFSFVTMVAAGVLEAAKMDHAAEQAQTLLDGYTDDDDDGRYAALYGNDETSTKTREGANHFAVGSPEHTTVTRHNLLAAAACGYSGDIYRCVQLVRFCLNSLVCEQTARFGWLSPGLTLTGVSLASLAGFR